VILWFINTEGKYKTDVNLNEKVTYRPLLSLKTINLLHKQAQTAIKYQKRRKEVIM
jgi:hypothetical protein